MHINNIKMFIIFFNIKINNRHLTKIGILQLIIITNSLLKKSNKWYIMKC